ncbi:probable Eukaryotic translation initiation factor 2A [Zygosaccharomyces bailii]|nr:probable Eukaryotic translation initiation factor 2A [Zygosaccharomyces bailii]
MTSQFFLKTSQDIELFQGYPSFTQSVANSTGGGVTSSMLSPCARFLALATKESVKVYSGELFDHELVSLPLSNVYDLHFSPSGCYLSTWERPSAQDSSHLNCKVWYLNKELDSEQVIPVFQYQAKTQNGWSLQFAKLDNYAVKQFGKELRIVKLDQNATFNFDQPYATLSQTQESESQAFSTYLISPAEHPTICTFTPEKSGKPAHLTIWPIVEGEISKKIVTKSFFKADSCQLQWNALGNAVLCVAITDFDSSNQSYYGENTLYLLSFQGVNGALGGNSVRVPLSKEGPIHDFTWSPTSRQFGVIYGYMPATITFFDLRGNVVHTMSDQAKNTMLFSPSGRYILVGGFGNLQGSVDILDRHDKFKCVSHFDAANTSVCKWSPGGEFIMTATTSPRLRVDNCIKIWHVAGKLVFVKEFKELLKVDWRTSCPYKTVGDTHVIRDWQPKGDNATPQDPKLNPAQLQVHQSAKDYIAKHPKRSGNSGSGTQSKGAYKPPHARRAGAGTRTVPGMNVVNAKPSPKSTVPGLVPGLSPTASKSAAKNKKRANKKKEEAQSHSAASPSAIPPSEITIKETSSPEEKKIRSLLKKLRAIEALKQRQSNGDKLEDTQVLKIQSEEKVLSELKFMGWSEENAN